MKGHKFEPLNGKCECGVRVKTLADHQKHSIAEWKKMKARGLQKPRHG